MTAKLSQFHKNSCMAFSYLFELNLLKPLYVHNDHLGTFDNSNAR